MITAPDAFDALAARNRELLDEGGDAIREALADQVAILEGVVTGFAYQAALVRLSGGLTMLASWQGEPSGLVKPWARGLRLDVRQERGRGLCGRGSRALPIC